MLKVNKRPVLVLLCNRLHIIKTQNKGEASIEVSFLNERAGDEGSPELLYQYKRFMSKSSESTEKVIFHNL